MNIIITFNCNIQTILKWHLLKKLEPNRKLKF